MNSQIALITVLTAALSAGGLMAKPDAAAPHRQNFMNRVSATLNLTDQQKQQAKSIFTSEREAARPIRQQLREDRKALESAIQAGKPVAEIEQLAKKEGPELGDLAARRAEAFAKFHALLTPAQQEKLASLHRERGHRHGAAQTPAVPENR